MKAEDIAGQLINKVPQLTDLFSDDFTVTSVVRAGTVLTVTTADAHGLAVNNNVALTGALTPIPLSALTRSGTVGTLVCSTNHDRVMPRAAGFDLPTTIRLSGSVEPEFNGTFTMLSVDNRKTITFEMADSGAVTATGSPIVEDAESQLNTIDRCYRVITVPSTTTFTVNEANTALPDPIGSIIMRSNPRISMGINPERLADAYTKNGNGKHWMFAVLGSPIASKDRALSNDAVTNLTSGDEYRQQVIFPFSVIVFIPTATSEIAAGRARDTAADLLTIICQSLLGHQFPTHTAIETQGAVNYISDDVIAYNTAFLVHEFNFTQVSDLIFEDTVGPSLDVAMRDIEFETFVSIEPELPPSTEKLDSDINLDDEPL